MSYNPSDVGRIGSLFGLPYQVDEADLIVLPICQDITTSFGDGTALAPDLILKTSSQIDLCLPHFIAPWQMKIAMGNGPLFLKKNNTLRKNAKEIIALLENGEPADRFSEELKEINEYCLSSNNTIANKCLELLEQGKYVAILGGDHSSPLGLIETLSRQKNIGILQIDAHMDLRRSYEGFKYSHASIMYNSLQYEGVQSLVQVGIRDYCEEELLFINNSKKPVHTFYDQMLYEERLSGLSWKTQVDQIIDHLPENVYISFDIDGLEPTLCPGTGTPVPGGLNFNQAVFLIERLIYRQKKIIGFDLCEVGTFNVDTIVGARILYRLAVALGASHGLISHDLS